MFKFSAQLHRFMIAMVNLSVTSGRFTRREAIEGQSSIDDRLMIDTQCVHYVRDFRPEFAEDARALIYKNPPNSKLWLAGEDPYARFIPVGPVKKDARRWQQVEIQA